MMTDQVGILRRDQPIDPRVRISGAKLHKNRQRVDDIPQRRGLDEQYPLELPGGHVRHHRDFGDWRGVRARWPCRTAALTHRETKYTTVTPLARPAHDLILLRIAEMRWRVVS